jgi:fructuronate reductase
VQALTRRRAAGLPPFAVLCCDNLPDNGPKLRGLLVDFARRTAPDLADHIAGEVAFPATMVDRITPAQTGATLALARELTGREDAAAIETERFLHWVIEDDFPQGRPAWDAGGAIFVRDVRPYEDMKLRMLNGAHSMLAYAGFLCGHAHVRDVMGDAALSALVRRHLAAAAATLAPLPGVDFAEYAEALIRRFENPHLAHETRQIASDGTEKLPQRIFAPALDALEAGQPLGAFAFATAAWMAYVAKAPDVQDPRATALRSAVQGSTDAVEVAQALSALPGLMPPALRAAPAWHAAVADRLQLMLAKGMAAAVAAEAGDAQPA